MTADSLELRVACRQSCDFIKLMRLCTRLQAVASDGLLSTDPTSQYFWLACRAAHPSPGHLRWGVIPPLKTVATLVFTMANNLAVTSRDV